ncbi:MAG: alcohol dehydrogenase catalytic domain-containing protein [Hyphomicrobiaceae bacterium]
MFTRQSIVAYGEPLAETSADLPVPVGSEVLLRVTHCGVCHSDIHLHDGFFDLGGDKKLDVTSGRPLPFTLGHEIAGTVEARGPEAHAVHEGQRYGAFPWIGCGSCGLCKRGDEHLCNRPAALGITVDGGYATHVLVPHPRYLLNVDGIAPELAGSYMCSGLTAFSALKKALPYLNAGPLMIVGLGGVGMMGLQFAQAQHAGPVYVADIDPEKREAALAHGAVEALDPANRDARKGFLKATGGAGAVIDFVGAEASFNFAYGVAGKGGAVVVVGLMGGSVSMAVPLIPMRAVTVIGSYVGSLEETKEMLALVKAGKVAAIPVETRALSAADAALNDLRDGKVLGRVVLTP